MKEKGLHSRPQGSRVHKNQNLYVEDKKVQGMNELEKMDILGRRAQIKVKNWERWFYQAAKRTGG